MLEYMEQSETVMAVVVVIVSIISMLCCCAYMLDRDRNSPHAPSSRGFTNNWKSLSQSVPVKTGWNISQNLSRSHIGVFFNQWRKPDSNWGPNEMNMIEDLGNFDIKLKKWDRATKAVDAVLDMLLQESKREAVRLYPGLCIDKFVRQGSSREGLKVLEADEFDVLLLFRIDGIKLKVNHLKDDENWILPEFGHLVVENCKQSNIARIYESLYREGVFTFNDERTGVFLNSRNLQKKVFLSIIMMAANSVEKRVNVPGIWTKFDFTIGKFRINPPSINIEIILEEKDGYFDYGSHLWSVRNKSYVELQSKVVSVKTTIDVDIVPGVELARDTVPDPTDLNNTMECPRYAVFKWFTENQPPAALYNSPQDILWRVCSSGYEKHMLDVSRGSKEECYIVTALRIMKHEFRLLNTNETPPRQIVTVLRSYHLKHIAFYCILYLVIVNKEEYLSVVDNMKLSGVREALAYFLEFLEVCLEESRLPHFFHANDLLVYMFPCYKVEEQSLRYDLFTSKSSDALKQAERSFRTLKSELKRRYGLNDVYTYENFPEAFREYIKAGKYYDKRHSRW